MTENKERNPRDNWKCSVSNLNSNIKLVKSNTSSKDKKDGKYDDIWSYAYPILEIARDFVK